jgi:hypothetical protein
MEIELAPAVTAPMVSPDNTTVTAVLAAMVWLAVVKMTEVPPVMMGAPKAVGPLGATKPADVTAMKKLEGNLSVMKDPIASAPPAVVVNVQVAAELVLPAVRSDPAIANETPVT